MPRLNALVVVGVILVLAGIGLSFMAGVAQWTETAQSGLGDDGSVSYTLKVTLLDDEGNPVQTSPMRLFSYFSQNLKEITQMQVDISWTCTGSNIDWTRLIVDPRIRIYNIDFHGTETLLDTWSLYPEPYGESAKTDSKSETWDLAELLSGADQKLLSSGDNGWELRIEATSN